MIRTNLDIDRHPRAESARTEFLASLQSIEHVARSCFRWVRCADRREECVFETVALCWLWHLRLHLQGRDSRAFIVGMSHLAAKAVKSGRRLCGHESTTDALSPKCQYRRGFRVDGFGENSSALSPIIQEALHDNRQTRVIDQVQFRIDFADWRSSLDNRRQRIVDSMLENRSTSELSERFGVTPGRVSQLRREFHEGYTAFCGDVPTN